MYGWMHENIRQLICRKYGKNIWQKILIVANFDEGTENVINHYYPDDDSERLFKSVTTVVDISMEELFEAYGAFLIEFSVQTGWDQLMLALGTDLKSFLDNMDSFHFFIDHAVFKTRLKGPSFRTEANADGSITLHYYSKRTGMYPIVQGVIKEISRQFFSIEVTVDVMERRKGSVSQFDAATEEEHVIFRIEAQNNRTETRNSITSLSGTSINLELENRDLGLNLLDFTVVFPYHVCFNRRLFVEHCGTQIQKYFPDMVYRETMVSDVLEIVNPHIVLNFQNIIRYINSTFVARLKLGGKNNKEIFLKGQMILLENHTHMIFVCSPYAITIKELLEKNLFLNDIPLHDATRDLILLNQSVNAQMELNKKLEEMTKELKQATTELEKETEKSDSLLKELLPANIADQLRRGKTVETRSFNDSTLLFADICSFTVICSHCKPIDVVQLLNDLYSKFDRLTVLNDVYKLITVGDGYVVVGGVPDQCADHAERICNLALGMLWESRSVLTPSKDHLRIRIGVHSGPVVGGIVGKTAPRFCLFGESMSIAGKVESSGVPSKIVVTASTFKLASQNSSLVFEERGTVDIKGHPSLMTYFLVKNRRRSLWELVKKQKNFLQGEEQTMDGYQELHCTNGNAEKLVESNTVSIKPVENSSRSENGNVQNNHLVVPDCNRMQLIVRYRNKEYNFCGSKVCSVM